MNLTEILNLYKEKQKSVSIESYKGNTWHVLIGNIGKGSLTGFGEYESLDKVTNYLTEWYNKHLLEKA